MPRSISYEIDTFSPPAPALTITLHFKRKSVSEIALLDTGSDITTITDRAVRTLGLNPIGEITVSGATGSSAQKRLYRADLHFFGIRYRNHALTLLNTSYMLIGRDILNEWITTLDGPKLRFFLK